MLIFPNAPQGGLAPRHLKRASVARDDVSDSLRVLPERTVNSSASLVPLLSDARPFDARANPRPKCGTASAISFGAWERKGSNLWQRRACQVKRGCACGLNVGVIEASAAPRCRGGARPESNGLSATRSQSLRNLCVLADAVGRPRARRPPLASDVFALAVSSTHPPRADEVRLQPSFCSTAPLTITVASSGSLSADVSPVAVAPRLGDKNSIFEQGGDSPGSSPPPPGGNQALGAPDSVSELPNEFFRPLLMPPPPHKPELALVDWRWACNRGYFNARLRLWNEAKGGLEGYLADRNARKLKRLQRKRRGRKRAGLGAGRGDAVAQLERLRGDFRVRDGVDGPSFSLGESHEGGSVAEGAAGDEAAAAGEGPNVRGLHEIDLFQWDFKRSGFDTEPYELTQRLRRMRQRKL
jgi:hypothetical protein